MTSFDIKDLKKHGCYGCRLLTAQEMKGRAEISEHCFYFSCEKGVLEVNRSLLDDSLNHFLQQPEDQEDLAAYFEEESIVDPSDMLAILRRQTNILARIHASRQTEALLHERRHEAALDTASLGSRVTVILCHGGHFAIAYFEDLKCLAHKSDHAYVCRKKAGGRQITKDKSKGISSMGSQIRRFNEEHHQQKINLHLTEFRKYMDQSDLVLMHAPGINRLILLQTEKLPLQKLRSLCLHTKKAKFEEIQRVIPEIRRVTLLAA